MTDTVRETPVSPAPLPEFLSPTGPGQIQEIKEELRATLASAPQASPPRSHLKDLEPSSQGAFVQWPLTLRTLGSDRVYTFRTGEVMPRAVFVQCDTFARTYFRPGSTIVQVQMMIPKILTGGEGSPVDYVPVDFLAKVAKVSSIAGPAGVPVDEGFSLQILQMEREHATTLADVLARLRIPG